ncbi:hypothetical protein DFA_08813 [Cavenderia fasciculata]|uniref:GB1/RHD3-type G domain-containing protein n=1 Tax=Cavenderia fasciculata TaxID=261658 RepID=F4Q4G4_CACFS|nr:uncharacterized protein DFA_08813 [Cavenderia fasciculata]EGG17813.1 hypothetical protein DFA_08813 [Cavenderia fasciculata]|eukprot:XP_004356297.1 hypothetical protein DFA_08813 [Cavenderia fasciculata]
MEIDHTKLKESCVHQITQLFVQTLEKNRLKFTNNFFNNNYNNSVAALGEQVYNDANLNYFLQQLKLQLRNTSIVALDQEKTFREYKKKLVLQGADYHFYDDVIDSGQLSYNDKNLDSGPIPLIYPNNCIITNNNDLQKLAGIDRTHLVLNPRAASIIEQIQGPLVIISVIGPYRSGKSYLLNRILSKKVPRGFELGHTMESCTMGVWMWGIPFKHSIVRPDGREEEVTVILLDTEGLGSTSKSTTVENDNQILSLSMLLSSNIVYNSTSVPTYADFDKLYFITKLSQSIVVRRGENQNSDQDKQHFDRFFPNHFSWVFRDCHLTPSLDGGITECTMERYMEEKVFRPEDVTADLLDQENAINRNRIRQFITNTFKRFNAYTITAPGPEALQYNIEDIENPFTSPKFHTDVANFVNSIKSNLEIKKGLKEGSRMNGSQLIGQLGIYLDDIKNGKSINVESTWHQTLKLGYESILLEAVQAFEKEINKRIPSLPISHQELMDHYQQSIKISDKLFSKILDLDADLQYFKKYSKRYHDECAKFNNSNQLIGGFLLSVQLKNNEASIIYNSNVIRILVETIINPVLGNVESPNHQQLVSALQLVEKEYFAKAKGTKIDDIYNNYRVEIDQKSQTFLSYLKQTNQFKDSLANSEADREGMRLQNSKLMQRQRDLEINIKTNQEVFQTRLSQMEASKNDLQQRMNQTILTNANQYNSHIQQLQGTINHNNNVANQQYAQYQNQINGLNNQIVDLQNSQCSGGGGGGCNIL